MKHEVITAEITGEICTKALVDNRYYTTPSSYRESLYGWDGCLDAPNLLPAGSTYDGHVVRNFWR